jgi:hypothetical protein
MIIIMTDRRNCILIEQASALTFISSVGPPLNEFNPEQYVKSWVRLVGSEILREHPSISILVEVNVTKVSSHKCFFPTKVLGVGTSL